MGIIIKCTSPSPPPSNCKYRWLMERDYEHARKGLGVTTPKRCDGWRVGQWSNSPRCCLCGVAGFGAGARGESMIARDTKKGQDQFSATNAAALRQGWQQTVAANNEGEYGANAGAFLRRPWRCGFLRAPNCSPRRPQEKVRCSWIPGSSEKYVLPHTDRQLTGCSTCRRCEAKEKQEASCSNPVFP